MIYPNMVYKNGERGDHLVCNNAEELIQASKDNFWPIRPSSKDEVLALIEAKKKKVEDDKKAAEEANKNLVPLLSPEEIEAKKKAEENIKLYEEETGKKAIIGGGPNVGKPTPTYSKWLEEKGKKDE